MQLEIQALQDRQRDQVGSPRLVPAPVDGGGTCHQLGGHRPHQTAVGLSEQSLAEPCKRPCVSQRRRRQPADVGDELVVAAALGAGEVVDRGLRFTQQQVGEGKPNGQVGHLRGRVDQARQSTRLIDGRLARLLFVVSGQQGFQAAGAGDVSVQQPIISTTSVLTTVSVPDGGTVLLGGVKRLSESRNMAGVPILNKIPYLSRLFKNTGVGRETSSLMLMVTPRIVILEEEEELLGIPK